MLQTWTRSEGRALLWSIGLQALQLGLAFFGPDAFAIPIALQYWVAVLPYMFPPALLLYVPALGLLGYLGFHRLAPGRLRTWTCGILYYVILLLLWPLKFGVGCPTCIQ